MTTSSSACPLFLHPKNRGLAWRAVRGLVGSSVSSQQLEEEFGRAVDAVYASEVMVEDEAFATRCEFESLDDIRSLQKWNMRTVRGFLAMHGYDCLQLQEVPNTNSIKKTADYANDRRKVHFQSKEESTSTPTPTHILKKDEVAHLQNDFEELQKVYESRKTPMIHQHTHASSSELSSTEDRPMENMEAVLLRHIEERDQLLSTLAGVVAVDNEPPASVSIGR